jgi:2-succinyl-6-hydroxy-2,4-cyclohexadiene-1-carboxylate synthase
MIKNLNGVPFHIEKCGSGRPLLLLHGFTGSLDAWQLLKPSMEKDFQLIRIDIIGHGKSGSPEDPDRYSMENAACDLKELFNQLHLDKVDVLGYSMGGRLALSFAMLYPECVDRLILESASPGLRTAQERANRRLHDRKMAERIRAEGMRPFVDFWQSIPLFRTQQLLPADKKQLLRDGRLANSVQGLAGSLTGMGTGSQPSWWDRLQNLTIPVLLITGEADTKFCRIAAEMNEWLGNSEWSVIHEAGHNTHLERPAEFIRILRDDLLNRS